MNAIIVDDEQPGARTLQLLIETYCPEVHILSSVASVSEAIEQIRAHQPTLVFLDIELSTESGFELLNYPECKTLEIIFTTAFEQYAIRAFRSDAVDYLLKPVDPDELTLAVAKAAQRRKAKAEPPWLRAAIDAVHTSARSKRIALPSFDSIQYIPSDELVRLEASSNYTDIYVTGGKKHTVTRTLKEFETQLLSEGFFRVHKAHLVNLSHVEKFVRTEGGYLLMKDGTTVPVSRNKKEELLRRLES